MRHASHQRRPLNGAVPKRRRIARCVRTAARLVAPAARLVAPARGTARIVDGSNAAVIGLGLGRAAERTARHYRHHSQG